MIFLEKQDKKSGKYGYHVEDAFGIMDFVSEKKLNAEELDDIFVAVFNACMKNSSETIEGDVDGFDGVTFTYQKTNPWKQHEQSNT